MATAYTSTELAALAGAFTGGLGGAPGSIRASDLARPEIIDFHFTQGGSQGSVNDTVDIAYLNPTDKLYIGRVNFSAGGAGVLLNIGRVDSNNSSNSSATRYLSALDISSAGTAFFEKSGGGGDQVGTDPAGDQTTGQTAPNFGSGKITIQMKFTGAGEAAAATVNGWIMVVRGN